MIELEMVRRMMRRAALVAPPFVLGVGLVAGGGAALSAAVGIAMAVANLWLAGRIIGGVAETNPNLLVLAAMVAFGLGLAGLTAIALGLQALEVVSFAVTGLTLIGAHLALVLWEAADAFPAKPTRNPTANPTPQRARS